MAAAAAVANISLGCILQLQYFVQVLASDSIPGNETFTDLGRQGGKKTSALKQTSQFFADLILDQCNSFLTTPLVNLELIAFPNFLTEPFYIAWETLEKPRKQFFGGSSF